MSRTYRDWTVDYDAKPIPHRGFDWTATHPDYDGEGDNRIVHAATFEELAAEIDSAIYEADPLTARDVIMENCGCGAPSSSIADRIIRKLGEAGFDIVVRERAA